MQKLKLKPRILTLFFLLAATIFAVCYFAVPTSAAASTKTISAELYKKDSQIVYRYFDFPTAIHSDSDSLYVAHNNNIIDTFSINDNTKTASFSTNLAADKIRKWDSKFITLEGGSIAIYDGSTRNTLAGIYIDFDIVSNKIFALNSTEIVEAEIVEANINITKKIPLNLIGTPVQIAASNNVVFIASISPFNKNKRDISVYTPPLGSVRRDLISLDNVLRMNILPGTDSLMALFGSSIEVFSFKNNGIISSEKFACAALTDFSVSAPGIFALTSDYSVKHFALNGSNERTIFASAHDSIGFFNNPGAAVTRRGNVIVADTLNDRITVSSDTEIKNVSFNFYRPESVSTDHMGNVYVAHTVNKIDVIDPLLSSATPLNTSVIDDKIIEIVYTSELKLYALTGSGDLFVMGKNENTFNKAADEKFLGIAAAPDMPYLYATLTTGSVKRFSANSSVILSVPFINGENFAVDKAENFYFLSGGFITRFEKSGTSYTPSAPYTYSVDKGISGYASHISISTINQPSFNLKSGDLIATDRKTHAVRILKKEDFSVVITEGGSAPDISGDDEPSDAKPSSRIIRVILEDCEVYATESEINRVAVIKKGHKVIVPEYNSASAYSMVIADNTTGTNKNTAVTGYVYNDFLSEPLEYIPSPETSCRVWQTTIAIFKYPSRQSPMLEKFKSVQKDTTFKLMDFCYEQEGKTKIYGYGDNFISNDNITWYKVTFGENDIYEGYVMKDGMSVRNSNPDPTIRPQFNAVIISNDENNPLLGAGTFDKVDGEYIAINAPALAVGAKVEVVGIFDTSVPYTQIRYSTEFGTIECYVLTTNIKYEGVNVVMVIVIICLIITAALLVCIFIKVQLDKKKLPTTTIRTKE